MAYGLNRLNRLSYKLMMNNQQNMRLASPWLSYTVALSGILASILIWYSIVADDPRIHLINSIEIAYPWIILILGISVATLVGFAIRMMQLSQQQKESYLTISADFQNEIAERLQAEETKQKLEKALLQGQKLQAIGTLAGGIAHDFNNILYAIIGYVEMTRDDVAQDSLIYKNLGKVLEGCKRGQELVARILIFSRRQHHELTPVKVKETIEGVLELLRPTIPATVSLECVFNAEGILILANQTQLHQVIVNLINNAVDAMDGEGHITIQVSRLASTEKLFKQFPHVIEGNYCKIQITDTGHGMDQTTLSRIFEPFYTTKEVGKGTGLGLSTVHSIIKEHQGEILVTSQLGHGTNFTLLIPEHTAQQENKNG